MVRTIVTGSLLGLRPEGDVLTVVFRTPNLIQNLLGEQALSASFIPVYSRLLAEGKREEAGRLAGAILGLLTVTASLVALGGVLLAEQLVALTAPGFLGDQAKVAAGLTSVDRYALAVVAVRIVFPMTAVLVVSAWALSVLNSHRRFLLPYLAPVVWNAAIIGALVLAGLERWDVEAIVLAACWGGLIGGVLQLVVQLPSVISCLQGFRLSLSTRVEGVRRTLKAFGPSLAGRGVVQLSSYVDLVLASLLVPGAAIALDLAQRLYLLPISLFGAAVATVELPELARETAAGGDPRALTTRLRRALLQAGGAAIPAAVALLALAPVLVAGLLGRGRFGEAEGRLVSLILAICACGIVPTVMSRVVQNTFYALGDTARPAKIAALRMLSGGLTGLVLMFPLDRFSVAVLPGLVPLVDDRGLRLGAAGLALGMVVASWTESVLLLRTLRHRLGSGWIPLQEYRRAGLLATAAAASALVVQGVLVGLGSGVGNLGRAILVGSTYALVWFALATAFRDPALAIWLGRGSRR